MGGGPPNLKAISPIIFSLNILHGARRTKTTETISSDFFIMISFFFFGQCKLVYIFFIAKSAILENTDRKTVK